MPTLIESVTTVPNIDVRQLASELVSKDSPNTAELGSDGRILVKLPEEQDFTTDLASVYRLAT